MAHLSLIEGEGIRASVDKPKDDAPRGLGDFQRRLNREERGRRGGRRDNYGDSTPRSDRDAPSVRVPNVGWDSTPRNGRDGEANGWGEARNRRWDAPTPRVARDGSPEEGAIGLDAREWEEEQLRLDRDWYTGAEEGGVTGDDDHNPLAQYEDLRTIKDAEIAHKQTVGPAFKHIVCRFLTNPLTFKEKSVCSSSPIRTSRPPYPRITD